MILEEKKEYILNKLNRENVVSVEELSCELDCTTASIRYIVNELAKNNMLKRVHGGIARSDNIVTDVSINILETVNLGKKEYIAEKAVDLISPKMIIILDSGTTNMVLARKLKNLSDLTVVTNSIDIVNILIDKKGINIIVLGGLIRPVSHSIVSFNKKSFIRDLRADKIFLNTGAFSINEGVTDPNFQEAIVKRDMIESAHEVILLADSTKCGKFSVAQICPIKKINMIITDENIERGFLSEASKLNIEVIY